MSIARTFAYMQNEIADELGARVDLLSATPDFASVVSASPIKGAIWAAIEHWERKNFYFNELVVDDGFLNGSDWVTSPGQDYYNDTSTPVAWTSPKVSNIVSINSMKLLLGNQIYPLVPRTYQYLSDVSLNTIEGMPTDWAYGMQSIQLWPTPDVAYVLNFIATQKFDTLIDDSDTNAWMKDGYDLIKSQAKLKLAEGVLQDQDMAAAMRREIYGDPDTPLRPGYLGVLRGETSSRKRKGAVRPTRF